MESAPLSGPLSLDFFQECRGDIIKYIAKKSWGKTVTLWIIAYIASSKAGAFDLSKI
jgi:hypothetical protein